MLESLAILLGGVVTYVTRVIFLISERLRPPKSAKRYLPLVGPAVLGAICIPGLLAPGGEFSLAATVPSVIAAVVAWAAWRLARRQLIVGLIAGLGVWWGLLWLLGVLGWA